MSKALIIFILVLASYLIVNQFIDNDDSEPVTEKKVVVLNNNDINYDQESEEVKQSVVAPPSESFKSDFIDITYAAVLHNEQIDAALSFSFHPDGTFEDVREMTNPKLMSGKTQGTYIINGGEIELIYTDDRDKNIFKFDNSIMVLQKDGSLKTGSVILTAQ